MGYTLPPRPSGVITLPEGITPSAAEMIRRDMDSTISGLLLPMGATYKVMSDFLKPSRRPADSYHRYRNDLYGPPTRDWLPFLNGALLASAAALLVDVALMLGGII